MNTQQPPTAEPLAPLTGSASLGVSVEHAIPIPPRSKWAAVLNEMEVGDSVLVTMTELTAIRAQAWKLGMAVVSRTIKPNQCRVWRTK